MDLLCIFLLVHVQVFGTWAWTSRNCLLLFEGADYEKHWTPPCPLSNATVSCKDVTDVKTELSAIAADVEILCISVKHGTTIRPATFTRFHHLKSVYIYGCLSAVLPGAFRGLTNLQMLSMYSPQCCYASVPSMVFGDLYALEDLKLKNYSLSEMVPDVFHGLSRVRRLRVLSSSDDFSEFLCKVRHLSASVEHLSVSMEHVHTVSAANCTTYDRIHFPALKFVEFSLPHVKTIRQNALGNFKRVSSLSVPMNDVLLAQLQNSGIEQLDQVFFRFNEVNITSVCEVVFNLSVTDISLIFNTLQEHSRPFWEKCYKLRTITLTGWSLTSIDLDFVSILKNVTDIIVSVTGDPTSLQDRSLTSLCSRHIYFTRLRHFEYTTWHYLTLNTKEFVCLSHLENLVLEGKFTLIESSAFEGLNNLQVLKLITTAFADKQQKVIEDKIVLNNLTIGKDAFNGLSRLRVLHVKAPILELKASFFSGLKDLLELSLQMCSIHTIEDSAFANLEQLKELYLSSNSISKIHMNTFKGLKSLETLILNNNPHLKGVEASSFVHLPSLRVLHLGSLRFSSPEHSGMQLLNLTSIFGVFPRQLTDLTLSSGVRPMTLAIADDSAPDVGLSLSLSGQTIVLWGCERRFLTSVTKLSVTADRFLCAPDLSVPLQYFTSAVNLQYIQWHTSIVQDLSGLKRLTLLKRLRLANVNLYNQPGFSVMFHGLTKLESLNLYNCLMSSFDRAVSVDMKSLRFLSLMNPLATTLSKESFDPLKSLRSVVLIQPQLFCNCENFGFSSWAAWERHIGVFLASKKQKPLQCVDGDKQQDLDRYGLVNCRVQVGFKLFLSTALFVLFLLLSVLMHQLHSNTRGRYSYDVYVSHSGKDESWVMNSFLPVMKQRGPPFLRLCLPRKDFRQGKDIVENITDGLYRSRRTLCLVSRHFLRSNWCSLEMRLGTYRLQAEHRDVLILVFLEKIPPNLLSAHHRLARLVKTRTYIEWPQDPAQQEAFWDRLWNKLLEGRVR